MFTNCPVVDNRNVKLKCSKLLYTMYIHFPEIQCFLSSIIPMYSRLALGYTFKADEEI